MDIKERTRQLLGYFLATAESYGVKEEDIFDCELNGCDGLIIYLTNGHFIQFNHNKLDVWSVNIFPYDIYSRKKFINGKWQN